MSNVAKATQTPSSDGDFGNRLSSKKQHQSLFLLRLDGHFVRLYPVMSPFEILQLFSRQSRSTEQQTLPFLHLQLVQGDPAIVHTAPLSLETPELSRQVFWMS